jgi:hypothetical protein
LPSLEETTSEPDPESVPDDVPDPDERDESEEPDPLPSEEELLAVFPSPQAARMMRAVTRGAARNSRLIAMGSWSHVTHGPGRQ